jgi:hypothetical protein
MRLVGSDTKKAKEMVAYADGVLDALEIKQGPSHMEVREKERRKERYARRRERDRFRFLCSFSLPTSKK